ncbi:MAG: dehydrogenase [Anaerolineales bacterium]|nr:xanthine dehydrogenase family protein subunit M [Anaerolineae bacterium]PWB49796.1 MAG: dehydrogenase [Anaerolineales bacterium]
MSLDSHPTLPEFDYISPTTLLEASQFLAQHAEQARPFLGGTDVLVRMRDGFLKPRFLVDVKNLPGMRELAFNPAQGLTIGSAVTMNQLIASPAVQKHYPLLAEACQSVASYQLRNRATVAGNICNASPAGDTLGACLALDARLQIYGLHGKRFEALSSFFLGPGKTSLAHGDLVTAIHLPPPKKGAVGRYLKLGRNKLSDLAIVAVTVLGWPEVELPSSMRIRVALSSVAPTPLLLLNVENYLAERTITSTSVLEAAAMAAEACAPIDDIRSSARYRKGMVKNLTIRALHEVLEKLGKPAL